MWPGQMAAEGQHETQHILVQCVKCHEMAWYLRRGRSFRVWGKWQRRHLGYIGLHLLLGQVSERKNVDWKTVVISLACPLGEL